MDIASKGGNYLLNVGPTAEGEIPQPSIDALKAIGGWMKTNGEAIYGTKASPPLPLAWGRCTQKMEGGNTILYLSVFEWPVDGKLTVPGIKGKVRRATLITWGKKLDTENGADGLVIHVPPTMPDALATVIKVEVK
ncbi:alpha-L-fucosidase [Puia sp. P3]|uniref:alpha-L-fucosidase n=1 Tax=Puia sp. P3 TaxID=3423952 RepID=UPI003D675033